MTWNRTRREWTSEIERRRRLLLLRTTSPRRGVTSTFTAEDLIHKDMSLSANTVALKWTEATTTVVVPRGSRNHCPLYSKPYIYKKFSIK
jgi:hypothetical protein